MDDAVVVLQVDDDPAVIDATAASLDRADGAFAVVTETSAADGLERLAEEPVDCVVSGYELPDVDGLSFLEAVREEFPDLPFVLFAGEESGASPREAIAAGVTAYLRKGSGDDRYAVLANRIEEAVARRRAERERTRYASIVESMDDGVYVFDADGRFAFVNGRVADIAGTPREAWIGEHVAVLAEWGILDDDGAARIEDGIRAILDGESDEVRVELDPAVPDGIDAIELRLTPLRTDGDERVLGVTRDVTERLEHRAKLERYRTVCESVEDGLYVFDADYYLAYCNGSYASMKGRPREELVGSHISELVDPAVEERGRRIREEMRAGNRDVAVIEYDLHAADGETIPVENRLVPLPFDDEFRGTAGVIRDVSERERREHELRRQNERLEEFAGIVSHDLRNPLDVATGRLELARNDPGGGHLDHVESSLRRMEEIIADVLTLMREGRRADETETVRLSTIADRCWSTVETGNATLRTVDDVAFEASPSRLRHLLENLFRNAVEHGSTSNRTSSDDAVEHGSTSDRAPPGDVDERDDDVTVTIGALDGGFYVEDDGPGIPTDEREAVFETGYSTAYQGTGYGLTIVAEMAEAHGWDVAVTGGSDGGARFEITGVATEPAENPTERQ